MERKANVSKKKKVTGTAFVFWINQKLFNKTLHEFDFNEKKQQNYVSLVTSKYRIIISVVEIDGL